MSEQIPQATHGSSDHPLRIGDLEIPCFVLEDGRRVLIQSSMISALGMSAGGSSNPKKRDQLAAFAAEKGVEFAKSPGDRLAMFVAGKSIQPYISAELLNTITNPIRFRTTTGATASGYEATILADICESVLQARADGKLNRQQDDIARQCEILVRGFARVGIIALVDEVTGYQEFRAKQALEEILRKFVSAELAKWAKTFDNDFYRELFRLRNLTYSEMSSKRPAYIGKITNDIVYERLAPGVLEELKRITPRNESGQPKHRLHQHLTTDFGHPKLREHLAGVITLMKASPNWNTFYRLLQRALPKFGQQLELDIPEEEFEREK